MPEMLSDPDAQQVLDRLSAAGWEPTAAVIDYGIADLIVDNGEVRLEAEFDPVSRRLRLTVSRRLVDVDVKIGIADCLTPLLDLLVDWQQRFDEDNWDDFLRAAIRICPDIRALITNDDGEIRSVPLDPGDPS